MPSGIAGDPMADHLIAARNAALMVIDHQPRGKPIGWVSLAGELQRERTRGETAKDVVQIVLIERLVKA
jgi:hypothetical protein